ncbi:hypothetical protein P168DRAFT_88138 [Aspergillus campestris IBT 28561]|uniref:Uncharacterized protein n=1 Tax=Aspergillus campestris (strain IBT 28561) TaxID=1392248 RepID=A0A2I1DB51_ASPC2|nr:uncharacterized protein P168DRAFT_88138 [Aspergillus campestris IBT 28561]PKY07102.1 hypothetical protein P168DRAFT_88138 [Aspergillus campestris IBT 28561]
MSDITDFLHRTSSRSNTRIPPIVAAHQRSSSCKISSSPPPSHMAALSRTKLHKETSARDPDLRRCLGHHRLLRRSVHLAQDDMQKAMISFQTGPDPEYASDSDSDSDDEEFDDYYLSKQQPTSHPREGPPLRDQIASVVKAMVRRKLSTSSTVTAAAATEKEDANVPSTSDWAFASRNSAEVSAQPGKFEIKADGGLSASGGILRTTTMAVSSGEMGEGKGDEVEREESLDVEGKENVEPLTHKEFGCPLQRQVCQDEQHRNDFRSWRKRRRFPLGRRLWSPNYEVRAGAAY